MPLILDHIAVWSRSFDEYQKSFNLTDSDLTKKILGCADGASSFNLEARKLGCKVTSFDPIYALSPNEIIHLINKAYNDISLKIKKNEKDYIWKYFKSPEQLCSHRLQTMMRFLEDYKKPDANLYYIYSKLPRPFFESKTFDIALVSHFLFVYTEQLTLKFHIESILNLCKIAKEVRIYPLHCNLGGTSPYLSPVINFLTKKNYKAEIVKVDFEVAIGSNKMLKISGNHE